MKMKSGEFIALSACTMTLTALGIDIMLPVLSEVRNHFNLPAESTATGQVIVFFFLGQVAQIAFGILSDRYGRLPILRVGFPLYIIGGLAATFAPSLTLMCVARFVAGVGASAVLTTTIAGVRDRYVGDEMARIMSLIFTIFLFTPILAPFLGIAILKVASWKLVFLTPPLFAVLVFLWSLRLKESLPKDQRNALNWQTISKSLFLVLTNRVFLRYTIVATFLFTGLSSYVASSEHIIGEIYHRPELFPWIFAGIGLVMSVSTFINSRLSSRHGARVSIRRLLCFYTFIAMLFVMSTIIYKDPPPIAFFIVAVALLMGTNIAIEPNTSALALESLGKMAGMAASIYGTFFFFVGASLGAIISNRMVTGIWPLVIGFAVIGVTGLSLVLLDRKPKE